MSVVMDKAIELINDTNLDYLSGKKSEVKYIKTIKTALEAIPFTNGKKDFSVIIVDNKYNQDFFGMRVYPAIDKLDAFTEEFINKSIKNNISLNEMLKRWKSIDSWVLEIDSNVFDRNTISFTNSEITALILHEIGHVIYSDDPVEMFYRAYKENTMRLSYANKASQRLLYNLYTIPLTVACMQKNWLDNNKVRYEVIADQTVAQLGYGNHLLSAIQKIIGRFGSINSSKELAQDEIDASIKWAVSNIEDVAMRRDTLRDELYYQAIKTNSTYLKAIRLTLMDKLGFRLRERYTGAVIENDLSLLEDKSIMETHSTYTVATEANKFDIQLQTLRNSGIATEASMKKNNKILLPSQYEIDSLYIELDKITNHHDRIFVLDLIYEVLDRVNTFEDVIDGDRSLMNKWNPKIKTMRKDLDIIRQEVMRKKISKVTHKLFVEVPEGYEG